MNETRPRRPARAARPVEANARLTGATSAVLLLLFCIEVATVVLGVRSMLTLHVMVGLLLVPPLLVKISSVSWRFFQYYRHDEAYRRQGPPAPALRILGPVLLAATLVLFTSGITLLLAPGAFGGSMKNIHGDTFYAWLLLMLAHVLAHARDLRRLAARDWMRRTRATVSGALVRQLAILASLALGLALALSLVAHVGTYRHHISPVHGTTAAVAQTSRPRVVCDRVITPVIRVAASTTVARWRSGSVLLCPSDPVIMWIRTILLDDAAEEVAKSVEFADAHLAAVDRQDWIIAKSASPSMVRSASLLVKMSRSGRVAKRMER